MPAVRILVDVAGPTESWSAGDVVEMNAEQAQAWADGHRGELIRTDPPAIPEDRTPRPETTTRRTRRRSP